MFLKATLTFLVVGALSVNALTVPVARSPVPEPESQELKAWMLKRDLSYDLFSREPEDWAAQWVKRGPHPPVPRPKGPRVEILEPAPQPRPPTPNPESLKKTTSMGRPLPLYPLGL